MSRPEPPQHNPYNQQPIPQQPPGFGPPPPPLAWQPPAPPAQPGQPYPAHPAPSFVQQPRSGNPFGAVALGFLASVVVSLVYSGIVLATYREQSQSVGQILYVLHALINGVVVGGLVGLVGRSSSGARIAGAVVAVLGAFFGDANAFPLITAQHGGFPAVRAMLEFDPFAPARVWWGSHSGTEWLSLLGLLVAAAAAWLLAFAVGRRRR